MSELTAIILTYNEENNIGDCISSIQSIAKRIIVVDSLSTDKTVSIALSMGADVFSHPFENQAQQFIWAMENVDISTKWILRFDADERFTEATRQELSELLLNNENTDVNGIVLRYEVEFMGKNLKHGGIYPFRKMFVFKNGKAHMENRAMDEHIVLDEGRSVEMKNDCLHLAYKDLTSWIAKHNIYASREADEFYKNQNNDNSKLNRSAKLKRIIKYNVYYKLPNGFRALLYFWYRYYIRLGFLDGKEGRIYAFMQAYWYRYLVDAKIYERQIMDRKR